MRESAGEKRDENGHTDLESKRLGVWIMWNCAIEEMVDRQFPVEQELMLACDCKLLKEVSATYPSSRHGYSTTILTSFFHSEFLAKHLSEDELKRLVLRIFYGKRGLDSSLESEKSESVRSESTLSVPSDCDFD